MTATTDYKGLVTITAPTGTGSQHVENQTKELADRAPTVNYALTLDPTADYDEAATYSGGAGIKFYVGSMIHNTTASPTRVWRCVDQTAGAAVWVQLKAVDTFLGLNDTPGSFTADRVLRVNAGGTAVEFVDEATLDTNAVTLQGRTFASTAPSSGESIVWNGSQWEPGNPTATTDLLSLTDITDSSYVGHTGHILRVNAGLTGMELIDGTTLFAPATHTHTIGDITNLQTNLDAKLDLSGGTMTGSIDMGASSITNIGRMTLQIGGWAVYPSTVAQDGFWVIQNGAGTSKYFEQNELTLNVMGADITFYSAAGTVGTAVAGTPTLKIDGPNGAIEWPDSTCRVRKIGSDLVFTDPTAGTYTLSQLANTGITIDDISGLREFVNEAFVFTQRSVIDRDLATPPGSPAQYAAYLVPSGATGDWNSRDGDIAFNYDSTWYFMTPVEGMRLWVADEDVFIQYDGTDWLEVSVPRAFGVTA